jgi:signal transduction histidine kinase
MEKIWIRWLQLTCCFLLLGISSIVQSETRSDRAFWRDTDGRATYEDVQKKLFAPYQGMLTQGYDQGAVYWLKLRIPASEKEHEWVLRFQPSWHDDLRLYDPLYLGGSHRISGDLHPQSADDFFSLGPSFKLPSASVARDVFIRISSVHSYQVDVDLLELKAAERSERLRILAIAMYFSWMILVLVLATFMLISSPAKPLVLFLVTEVCALLYTLHLFGVPRVVLDGVVPNLWLHHTHVLSMLLTAISITQFYSYLLSSCSKHWGFSLALYFTTSLPILALGLYAAGYPTAALELNSVGVALFAVSAFAVAWLGLSTTRADSIPLPNWSLRLFFSFILLVGFFNSVPLWGWIQASRFTMWVFVLHGPLLLTFMGLALVLRYRQVITTQEREVKFAQMIADQERIARAEQSKLLAMINHEVKTPMAVLKLLLADQPIQAKAEAQVDAVVTLIERCLLLDQLNDLKDHLSKEPFQPLTVVQQCISKTGADHRIKLTAPVCPTMCGDSVLYGVVVSNLLDNALKYSPPDSPIEVELADMNHQGQPCTRLVVTNDTGRAGVPDPKRMYDKYYRADGARHVSGTGLGLYLVRFITDWLGGEVTCNPDSTKVRFEICIPR